MGESAFSLVRRAPDVGNDNSGHRDRLRLRFLESGAPALSDHELLELLLTYAIPRRDVKPVAKRLLTECGDLAGVLGAPESVLRTVKGVGTGTIAFLRVVQSLPAEAARPGRRKGRVRIGSVYEALQFLRASVVGKREEEVHVLFLNQKNAVIAHELLVRGGPDQASIQPRKVMEPALAKRASGILLAHNHPSGNPYPSSADRALTRAVALAATSLDLRLLDHIIIGDGTDYSFKQVEPELWSG